MSAHPAPLQTIKVCKCQDPERDHYASLETLARRFSGVKLLFDVQKQLWYAQNLVNKNERAEYRVGAFGATAADAVTALLERIAALDESKAKP